jgi:hypothetical protein
MYFIVMIGQVVIVLRSDDNLPQAPLWVELLFSLAALGFAGVPVAIGFAVLKYRLYDIDVATPATSKSCSQTWNQSLKISAPR